MAFRGCIPDFQIANPLYVGATVSFFTVAANGTSTGVLATLFVDPTSATTAQNPQTLDSEGKFAAPVYIQTPVIASVVGPNVLSHTTGVINPRGTWRGFWAASTIYYSSDFIADPITGNVYLAALDYTSSSSIVTDVNAGNLVVVINQTQLVAGGAGLSIKQPVQACPGTADGNLALSGLVTIDGYQTVAGDRILVNKQTNPAQNGIYNAASGAWTRAIDANASSEFAAGCVVYVLQGTVNQGKAFQLFIPTPFTLGTSSQNWVVLVLPNASIDISLTSAPDNFLRVNTTNPAYKIVPFNCTITQLTLIGNTAGSISMDIWRQQFTLFPPGVANSITGSDPPTLNNAQTGVDTTLTGWHLQLFQGDVLAFVINSVSGLSSISLSLALTRN